MASNITRLQRTYEVTLTMPGLLPVSFPVNLSYDLNDELEPVEDGKVVVADSVMAKLAAVNRLRRLSARGKVDVSTETINESDWDVRLVRHRLVTAS